ncbi:MAG: MraY family glycosyltransferase [Bacillota bacterium]|nr:MraY family glycosyltransferase [Bacillota bacterium]
MFPLRYIYVVIAFVAAAFISFLLTPVVKSFAQKVGAIDVPTDSRRMHKKPIPRLGGLAIFFGFFFTALLMVDLTTQMRAILIGGVIILVLGIFDDIYRLDAMPKFIVQIVAALIPALSGVEINFFSNINLFSNNPYLNLGVLTVPITVFWIVGITNAVNFVDGLDGLACGVSSIACFSLLCIALILGERDVEILTAALAGACIGFLPYNLNPAKIFMGDTGSTFLGYILAIISIQGLFKFYALVSFAVPFLILGLPIFDTAFAILRRIASGRSPMSPDRSHLHHRLIDMGFSQKQTVAIIYSVSIVCGISAVLLTQTGTTKAVLIVCTALVVFLVAARMYHENSKSSEKADNEKN